MSAISRVGGSSIQSIANTFMKELSALDGGQSNGAQGAQDPKQLLNDLMQMLQALNGQVSSRAAPTHVAW